MKNDIYVLTLAGCPEVYAENTTDLFRWCREHLSKLLGIEEKCFIVLDELIDKHKTLRESGEDTTSLIDIEENIYEAFDSLNGYEMNIFRIKPTS